MSEIFSQIFAALLAFFPHRVLVRSTHGGVKFRGGKVKRLRPGSNWYWPLFTEVEVIDTAPGPMDIEAQSLMTSACEAFVVTPMVRYRVTDVVRALGHRLDIATIIEDHVSAAVAYEFSDCKIEDVMDGWEEIGETIAKKCNEELLADGVEILWVGLREFSKAKTLRHIMGPGPTGDEE
jgi:regulator of protease activity HflC (stomatin/prohibitin superfamily)